MTPRVRFAPSPTGHLHIGGARTALFNWLFARSKSGVFILRIEDTDRQRSSEAMVDEIQDGLRWLGLTWDEGPFFQSQRMSLYHEAAGRLLDADQAYYCFCPAGVETDAAWKGCRCGDAEPALALSRLEAGEEAAVRFKVPRRQLRFEDRVFGRVEVDTSNLEDFILLRSDRNPTYHLSVVTDDIDMEITHVIRGADHLSNTAKHILLFEALGRAAPEFAHLPLILGQDKKRLSKRHGATAVSEYQTEGYLPAAVRNYLALLGWSPGNNQELFTDDELVASFDLSRVNKADAVFDLRKLEWVNGKLMNRLPAEKLEPEVRRILQQAGLWKAEWAEEEREWFLKTIDLLKKGLKRTLDFATSARAFFSSEFDYEPGAVERYIALPDKESRGVLRSALNDLATAYRQTAAFDLEPAEAILRQIAERYDLKAGALIGAVRVALTGQAFAPGIFEVMITLGRVQTIQRIERCGQVLLPDD